MRKPAEPTCESCGYALAGIGFRGACPECGSSFDLGRGPSGRWQRAWSTTPLWSKAVLLSPLWGIPVLFLCTLASPWESQPSFEFARNVGTQMFAIVALAHVVPLVLLMGVTTIGWVLLGHRAALVALVAAWFASAWFWYLTWTIDLASDALASLGWVFGPIYAGAAQISAALVVLLGVALWRILAASSRRAC